MHKVVHGLEDPVSFLNEEKSCGRWRGGLLNVSCSQGFLYVFLHGPGLREREGVDLALRQHGIGQELSGAAPWMIGRPCPAPSLLNTPLMSWYSCGIDVLMVGEGFSMDRRSHIRDIDAGNKVTSGGVLEPL